MSTRSGKRIHSSPQGENNNEIEATRNGIKTRSKRMKNKDFTDKHLTEKKRKKHYVRYPSDEKIDNSESNGKSDQTLRKSRRNTLMERNADDITAEETEVRHPLKTTRSTRKCEEPDDNNITLHVAEDVAEKKKKKKKAPIINENKMHMNNDEVIAPSKKKTNKKRNKKKSSSITVEEVVEHPKMLNASGTSVDSFHSAAGSPKYEENCEESNMREKKSTLEQMKYPTEIKLSPSVNNSLNNKGHINKVSWNQLNGHASNDEQLETRNLRKRKSSTSISNNVEDEGKVGHVTKQSKSIGKKKRKLSNTSFVSGTTFVKEDKIINCTFEKDNKNNKTTTFDTVDESNITFDKEEKLKRNKTNNTTDKDDKSTNTLDMKNNTNTALNKKDQSFGNYGERNSFKINYKDTFGEKDKTNTTFDKEDKYNSTFNKEDGANSTFVKEYRANGTFDKKDKTNTTFDKEDKTNSTFDTEDRANSTFNKKDRTNSTFDKKDKTNSTFDKEDRANSTFNKEDRDDGKFDKTNTTFHKEDRANSTFDKKDKTNTTFDKEDRANSTFDQKNKTNTTFDKEDTANSTFDKKDKTNTTFDKEDTANSTFDKKEKTNTTFDKEDRANSTFDKKNKTNTTFDKNDRANNSFNKKTRANSKFAKKDKTNTTFDKEDKVNTTFDKDDRTFDENHEANTTFVKKDKANSTFDKSGKTELAKKENMYNNIANENSVNKKRNSITIDKRKSEINISSDNISNDNSNESLLTSDTSKSSHISVTSDESQRENILNNTPLLVESSMEEENISKTTLLTSPTPRTVDTTPSTPLKREGTFTKDSPEPKVFAKNRKSVDKTPTRRKSLPSPGCTPFPLAKSLSKDKSSLNVTRSIEKSRRSSIEEMVPRATKVMFCSPSNNLTVVSAMKGKIIKSSLKGSNKSFIFDDNSCSSPPRVAGRKRSQTADRAAGPEPHAKRSRLVEPPVATVPSPRPPRLRTRTLSASAKLPEVISEARRDSPARERVRTRLPNFAALHARQFARMESLDECQRRRAERARLLLTPTGPVAVDRLSPKDNQAPKQSEPNPPRKTETPTKSKPQAAAAGYSRFGFKLQADFAKNPFSFTASKTAAAARTVAAGLKRQATMPSLAGTTRKQLARQAVMREKSFAGKRDDNRQESRTVIKGVRTNRRFELQMRMRNINT
ncbi:dentin sialophosphoprotein isoform X2 [Aricia agestis]|uniref:dentin sialophosphoprotein isoform X2 n=1 Tax=Aricia agestis TaxID=91739 RepID=UPI001C209FFE|nr:dentin sialophosphoprotein isoform X2 [Aricia agestis]